MKDERKFSTIWIESHRPQTHHSCPCTFHNALAILWIPMLSPRPCVYPWQHCSVSVAFPPRASCPFFWPFLHCKTGNSSVYDKCSGKFIEALCEAKIIFTNWPWWFLYSPQMFQLKWLSDAKHRKSKYRKCLKKLRILGLVIFSWWTTLTRPGMIS